MRANAASARVAETVEPGAMETHARRTVSRRGCGPVPSVPRAEAEQLVDNPNLNYERERLILDLDPTSSAE
jgi:hypothetical protein